MKNFKKHKGLPGFDHINTYYDQLHHCTSAKILPGEYYVTALDECVVTVLGSCVSACVRDKTSGIGGMNHFMLPVTHENSGRWDTDKTGMASRYGDYAMKHLLDDVIKHGGDKNSLEVKIFGGGLINAGQSDVGAQNIKFAREFLQNAGMPVAAEDLGGTQPRKVYFFPKTGKVMIKRIDTLHNDTIQQREMDYRYDLKNGSRPKDVKSSDDELIDIEPIDIARFFE